MPNSAQIAVEVHQPVEMTDESVERVFDALGLADLGETLEDFAAHFWSLKSLPRALWITVDGKPHTVASAYLEHQQNLTWAAQQKKARHLRLLIDFTVNWKRYPADRCDLAKGKISGDVFDLTRDDYAELKEDLEDEWQTETWNSFNSTVKDFFHFSFINFKLPGPFLLSQHQTKFGKTLRNSFERRGKRQSIGLALEPDWVRTILQTWKSHGASNDGSEFYSRDLAFMSLALATGMRRSSLLATVTYEVPEVPVDRRTGERLVFADFQVPWATTKNFGGSDPLAFSQYLPAVHAWIGDLARRNLPEVNVKDPIVLTRANAFEWEGHAGAREMSGKWADTRMDVRARMVEEDGSSPLLFLNQHGRPLSERSASDILPAAADLARKQPNMGKLPTIRLHDTRHTYAVHLGFYFTKKGHDRPIDVVRNSLGHMSEESTRGYTQALTKMTTNDNFTVDDVAWGCV